MVLAQVNFRGVDFAHVFFTIPLILASTAVGWAGPPVFVQEWGGFGLSPGRFHEPLGIAVAENGMVAVVDEVNTNIQVFTLNGDFVRTWGSVSSGQFGFLRPQGVAIDDEGSLYISQANLSTVDKYTTGGAATVSWGNRFGGPRDVAWSRDGTLYVVEQSTLRFQRLRSDTGEWLGVYGSSGTAPGQFVRPWGIGLGPDGSVFVADPGANRISKFTPDGEYIFRFGGPGTGPGQFAGVVDVAVGPDGLIFATDFGNHRVQVFNESGGYLFEWGGYGLDPGKFRYPWGIAIGSAGDVFVTDVGNHRVQRFAYEVPIRTTTWSTIKAGDFGPAH